MQQNWLGMRPEDLAEQERTMLERDLQLSAVHRAELNFGGQLANLPYLGRVIVLDDIRNYAERMGPFEPPKRPNPWIYGIPLLVVVALMLIVMAVTNRKAQSPPEDAGSGVFQTNQMGLIGEPEGVLIGAFAKGLTGKKRPIDSGHSVYPSDCIEFNLQVKGNGHVLLGDVDTGQRLFPAGGTTMFIESGENRLPYVYQLPVGANVVQLRVLFCSRPVLGEGFPEQVPADCSSRRFDLNRFE